MSNLFILTRPSLVSGFQLAGIDAYGAENVEAARSLIDKWLDAGEVGLLAIDDGLLAGMDRDFIKRLDGTQDLIYIAIPGGQPQGPEASERHRISEIIRHAIGFHITFKGEEKEGK